VSVPASPLKVAFVAPAGTSTDGGTVSFVVLLLSFTVAPPIAAGADKVTVQLVLAPDRTYTAGQSRIDTTTAGLTVRVVVFVDPLAEAVMVTLVEDVPEIVPTVALNAAVDDPAGIVTEAGTVTTLELLFNTTANAAAAGVDSVTVQGIDEFGPTEEELQVTDEITVAGGVTVNDVPTEIPFHVAVI
jgi:hypothetical protein